MPATRVVVPGGPVVVALGGGHGLAATLRATRRYASRITAVVAAADDGGSSGRLRRELGLLPPGDLRRCLVALAGDDTPFVRAFEHRFASGDLAGHPLGNLVFASLADHTGDPVAACDEVARLLGCVGRVLPASTVPLDLRATSADGALAGQALITRSPGVRAVSLVPADPPVPAAVTTAIDHADQVVLGPGSLYTSVLAAAIAPAIRAALAGTSATRVFVANLRGQPGETEGYDLADHVRALTEHGICIDVVLAHGEPIDADVVGVRTCRRPVAGRNGLVHDPGLLGRALAELASARL